MEGHLSGIASPPRLKNRLKGSYALVLRPPSRRKITVGKLGLVEFPRGYYIYFGSALDCRCGSHLVRLDNVKQVRQLLRNLAPAPRRLRMSAQAPDPTS